MIIDFDELTRRLDGRVLSVRSTHGIVKCANGRHDVAKTYFIMLSFEQPFIVD